MANPKKLSLVICAYNPKPSIFKKVIDSLKKQSLSQDFWELIIVDNHSTTPISDWLDLAWHQEYLFVIEKKQGLIHARNAGTLHSKYDYIVTVDDDTPLYANYLEEALKIYHRYPDMGIIGGRSFPIYEIEPPAYVSEFESYLAIRDLGEQEIIQQMDPDQALTEYPKIAPILIAPRKSCMLEYLDYFNSNNTSSKLGRKGSSLASGEDNDINLFIYKKGYPIGYFPQLQFDHIIPRERLKKAYFAKMAFESNRSWIKVLKLHEILPWKPISKKTLPLRYFKSFLKNHAWSSPKRFIRWKAACGTFKGLADLD